MSSSVNKDQKMLLKEKKVSDVLEAKPEEYKKRTLVEVPYTATLGDTMNALLAHKVVAVPVAAPPGHWIGAGGSMILEADKQTGTVRKHYIGMVTMLDILSHIAEGDFDDMDRKMSVPVSSIIGHCLESLSLWTLNPNTSIIDCMEVFSKGIHRVLVPIDSLLENTAGVELVESASGYQMLTQMDLMRFFKLYDSQHSDLKGVMSRPVRQFGAVIETIFAVTDRTEVIQAIKCMRAGSLNALPVVESLKDEQMHGQLINGYGRKLVGTFSATDLRECRLPQLQSSCLTLSVLEFTAKCLGRPPCPASSEQGNGPRELVTCFPESSLGEVVDKAVTKHVHRVWVVDELRLLIGLMSLTDMIRMIRVSLV